MSDYPMLISNKLHSFRNFLMQRYTRFDKKNYICEDLLIKNAQDVQRGL